jgi:DNA-binding response OmpR family regulator
MDAPRTAGDEPKGNGMSMKVLLVEPDWRFAQMASDYLESHAHLVVRETRADSALQRADHWQPDLAIVAAELAEDGFAERLAEISPGTAVLLTGWLDRYDIAWRAWQTGGDELLMKPVFSTDELHEAIVAALENATTGVRHGRQKAASA